MGKSQKPLTILVHPDLAQWPEIHELAEKGHTVYTEYPRDLTVPDLVLGPNCWRLDMAHKKYLPLAIAAGRKQRYPKEK